MRIGPTNTALGSVWDKGHFIAHSIGGAVDRAEINIFTQRRDLNRGWSEEGKTFRAMEEYCLERPGTFCFARPLYSDGSSRPTFLEFGLCKSDGTLWVERFDNRGDQARTVPHTRYTARRKFGSVEATKPRKPKK